MRPETKRAATYSGPGPCDVFACPKKVECFAHSRSCTAYEYFVETGYVIRPDSRISRSGGVRATFFIDASLPAKALPNNETYDRIYSGEEVEE